MYRALNVDWVKLADMLLMCQGLRYLCIDSDHLAVQNNHPAVPLERRAALFPQRRNLAIQFVIYGGNSSDIPNVRSFLASISCEDPKHFYLELSEDVTNWLISEADLNAASGLHLSSNCGLQRMPRPMSVMATVLFDDARTRSAKLIVTGLSTFSSILPALTVLTIEERFWPYKHRNLPAMPRLRTLTIVLEHPKLTRRKRHGPIGIFFLSLAPGKAWHLPALHELHIAYADPGEDWSRRVDPRSALLVKPPCGAPLVISAYELAAFLSWNLRSGHPLQLVLHNTHLFEPPGSTERTRLSGMVESMVFETDYDPRPVDYYTFHPR